MSVDYSKQYRRSQLEPFFPNEMIKMVVSILVTLAVIVVVALVFPEPAEEPANPSSTPEHIKPEWYFLATYQSLKLMPQDFLGISGKLLGVLAQTVAFFVLLTVPFWYVRIERRAPRFWIAVTFGVVAYMVLTLWGVWPEDSMGRPGTLGEFIEHHGLLIWVVVLVLVCFYGMMWWERVVIRKRWEHDEPDAA